MTTTPFRIAIPQADLDDLNRRLTAARWPARPRVDDGSRGIATDDLRALAEHWATKYDWRAHEAELNAVPQFTAEIGGQTVHFLHVRSPHDGALPLLLTHGWPSSPVEFLRVIGPLTDPPAYGGRAADAFHLVIPSLPGYGFSPPAANGFDLFGVAAIWAALMAELGYERYLAHGTDVGSGVAGMLPMVDPQHVVGVHLTGTSAGTPFGPALETTGLSPADRDRAERFNTFREDGTGYLAIQQTRPQTLGYALHDSPIGQLAWIAEKVNEWTGPGGDLDTDQLLTLVSLYWFTGSGASTAHAVCDGMQAWRKWAESATPESGGESYAPPAVPTGVAVFAADTTIRSLMDPAGTIHHYTEYDRGGHFPAMEVPDLLAADLRTFARDLRG